MNKKILNDVNYRYQATSGKFYQMFAGLRSSLTKYRNNTLFLNIYISERWNDNRDALSTAFQMARDWRHVDELKDASHFEARCYYLVNNQPVGFSFSLKEESNALTEKVNEAIKALSKPIVPTEDRIIVISGLIDADIPCDLSPNRRDSNLPCLMPGRADLEEK